MSIVFTQMGAFTVESADGIAELPDPSGGTFNAAGDFEQVIPRSLELSVLDRIDPYTDRRFSSEELGPLLRLRQAEEQRPPR